MSQYITIGVNTMFVLGIIVGIAVAFAAQAFFRQYKLIERNKSE